MPLLRLSAFLTAALLAGTQYSVANDYDARDLSVQQQVVAQVDAPAANDMSVTAWVDREDNRYTVGEAINLSVKVGADAYLTIISVGPSGNAVQLYPNAFQPGVMVKAGETVEIPGKDAVAQIVATSPAGNELIRVIASSTPIDVIDPTLLTGPGAFKSISGGAERLARDLAVAVEEDRKVDFYDKVIKTREATAEVSTQLVPPTTADPEVAEADVAAEPEVEAVAETEDAVMTPKLAPMIATDKADYLVGDMVQLAVTALEACHLWVVNVSSDGSVNVLFPNKLMTENALEAAETALVSGGNAPVQVVAQGPAGEEAIYALCSADATPPWTAGVDFTALFPGLSTDDGLGKALTAIDPTASEQPIIPDVYAWSVRTISVTAE